LEIIRNNAKNRPLKFDWEFCNFRNGYKNFLLPFEKNFVTRNSSESHNLTEVWTPLFRRLLHIIWLTYFKHCNSSNIFCYQNKFNNNVICYNICYSMYDITLAILD